jgi:hypothetical protein
MVPYPLLRPRRAEEEAMRQQKIRQRELFDDHPAIPAPVLQGELRDELLQLLTRWLYTLSEQMTREAGDE